MEITLTRIAIIALIFLGLACFFVARIINRRIEQKKWNERFILLKNEYLKLIHIRKAKSKVQEYPENTANIIRTWLSIDNTESSPEEIINKMTKINNSREKAAMFCIAIGKNISAEILKHLSKKEAGALINEIKKIDKIKRGQKYAVLKDFKESQSI